MDIYSHKKEGSSYLIWCTRRFRSTPMPRIAFLSQWMVWPEHNEPNSGACVYFERTPTSWPDSDLPGGDCLELDTWSPAERPLGRQPRSRPRGGPVESRDLFTDMWTLNDNIVTQEIMTVPWYLKKTKIWQLLKLLCVVILCSSLLWWRIHFLVLFNDYHDLREALKMTQL